MSLRIEVSIADQELRLIADHEVKRYSVSTALNGAGEASGSECTPRGLHRICAVIGQGCENGAVFIGRRPTGELYSPELADAFPERDWILTRILWLQGLEPGKNRLGSVDSKRRYIYIHGTPDTEPMGVPKSHGCVRMRNADVIELANEVQAGVTVMIQEQSFNKTA